MNCLIGTLYAFYRLSGRVYYCKPRWMRSDDKGPTNLWGHFCLITKDNNYVIHYSAKKIENKIGRELNNCEQIWFKGHYKKTKKGIE